MVIQLWHDLCRDERGACWAEEPVGRGRWGLESLKRSRSFGAACSRSRDAGSNSKAPRVPSSGSSFRGGRSTSPSRQAPGPIERQSTHLWRVASI